MPGGSARCLMEQPALGRFTCHLLKEPCYASKKGAKIKEAAPRGYPHPCAGCLGRNVAARLHWHLAEERTTFRGCPRGHLLGYRRLPWWSAHSDLPDLSRLVNIALPPP